MHPGKKLRELASAKTVGLPGAFNGLVARAVADAGFEAAYVSGAAVTASAGAPDIGLLSVQEFTRVIGEVTRSGGLPTIADADTGFGEGEMVVRTVHEYDAAGAAGLHIEDQVFPKRCGHLDGKTLEPADVFAGKVDRAVGASRACSGGEFIVCARTDAAGVTGLADAIDRAKLYIDAGADMIFPEGLRTEDEFGLFAEALRGHKDGVLLLANMTEFGKTPMLTLDRFGELGYGCVIWPVTTLRAAMGEVTRVLATIREQGSPEARLGEMQTRAELYRLLRYTPGEEWSFPTPASGSPPPPGRPG